MKINGIKLSESSTNDGSEIANDGTKSQLVSILSNLYSVPLNYKQFIKIARNSKFQKSIIAKSIFNKRLDQIVQEKFSKKFGELSEQELKLLDEYFKDYEFFQIYGTDGKPLLIDDRLPVLDFRKNCHGSNPNNEGLENYHRASDFIIINANNEVLISLRSKSKDTYPNYWELGGGHVGLGESFEETLIREVEEEQGIKKGMYEKEKLGKFTFIDKNKEGRQFQHQEIFIVNLKEGVEINPDELEVAGSKWIKIDELFKELKDYKLIPHQKMFLLKYMNKIGYDIQEYLQEVDESIKANNVELVNQEWFI